jgi:hypothetical protein
VEEIKDDMGVTSDQYGARLKAQGINDAQKVSSYGEAGDAGKQQAARQPVSPPRGHTTPAADYFRSAQSNARQQPSPAVRQQPARAPARAPVQQVRFGEHHENLSLQHSVNKPEIRGKWKKPYDRMTHSDPNEWMSILRRCRNQNTQFTDDQFPPDDRALYKVPSRKHVPNPNGSDQLRSCTQWRRVSEIFARDEVCLFDRGADAGDVRQGQCGDCYFLGALSVVATDAQRLYDIFPDIDPSLRQEGNKMDNVTPKDEQVFNEAGVYAVQFWREGQWHTVVVDDFIPCDSDGNPCHAHPPTGSSEVWVMIVEKAYAKFNGCYENIIGGEENEALVDLTGGLPFDYNFRGKNADAGWSDPDKLRQCLLDDVHGQDPVLLCCHTYVEQGKGIVPGHAYGILNIAEVDLKGQKETLIHVRNPWGVGKEWTGAWSDGDERWDRFPEIKARLQPTQSHEEDGTWWMTYNDFRQNMDKVSVCRLLNHYNVYRCEGEFLKASDTAGGNGSMHNPQFQVRVTEPTRLYCNISQPSSQPFGLEQYDLAVGPMIMLADEAGVRDLTRDPNEKPLASSFDYDREAAVCLELVPRADGRPYVIIPRTDRVGGETNFWLSAFTDKPVDFKYIPVDGEASDGTTGYADQQVAGGCFPAGATASGWRSFPQYILDVGAPGRFTVQIKLNGATRPSDRVGFRIIRADSRRQKLALADGDILHASETASSELTEKVELQPGTYIVLPILDSPPRAAGAETQFDLSVMSRNPAGLQLQLAQAWHQIRSPGQWSGRMSGGCRGSPSWTVNPTIKFNLNQPSATTIILNQPASMGTWVCCVQYGPCRVCALYCVFSLLFYMFFSSSLFS